MSRVTLCCLVLAAPLWAGCGPRNNPTFEKTVPIAGSIVMSNGVPLPGGRVTFHPKDPSKSAARGMIGPRGRFEMGTYKKDDGVMPGAYTVTVEPMVYDDRGNLRRWALPIPSSYTDPQSSSLTVEVSGEGDPDMKIVLR